MTFQKILICAGFSVVFIYLRNIQKRFPGISSFDLFVIFGSIAIYTLFRCILFDKLFSGLQDEVATNTIKDLIDTQSFEVKQFLTAELLPYSASASDYDTQKKLLGKLNYKLMFESEAGWWVYFSWGFALLSVLTFIKDLIRNETEVTSSKKVVAVLLLFIFTGEILVYYGVFRPYVFLNTSDLVRVSYDTAVSTLASHLSQNYAGNLQLQQNLVRDSIKRNSVSLIDYVTDMKEELQNIQGQDNSSIILAITSIISSLAAIAEKGCSSDTRKAEETLKLSIKNVSDILSVAVLNYDTTFDVQNILLSWSETKDQFDVLLAKLSCQRTKDYLPALHQLANPPQLPRISLFGNILKKMKEAWHLPILILLTLFALLMVSFCLLKKKQYFDFTGMLIVLIALILFQISFVSFVHGGKFRTLGSSGFKYLLYAALQNENEDSN